MTRTCMKTNENEYNIISEKKSYKIAMEQRTKPMTIAA